MGAKDKRWSLYVDESGNFANPLDVAVVVGLLVDDDLHGASSEELRLSLQRALPVFPWPLHAKNLNQPAYVALAWHARGESLSQGAETDQKMAAARELSSRAVRYLQLTEASATAQMLSDLKRGGEPNWDTLNAASQRLRRQLPDIHSALDDLVRDAWARVSELFDRLVERAQKVGAPSILLVTAAETQNGDALPGSHEGAVDSRYFTLLGCVAERVVRTVERFGGRHRVAMHVLPRNVYDPYSGRQLQLRHEHVGNAVRAVLGSLGDSVRLVPQIPAPFDAAVGGALVLADLLSNQARTALAPYNSSLSTVESGLATRFYVSVRSGVPGLSHLAASGKASVMLRGVEAGEVSSPKTVLPFTPDTRKWACEQAWEWAEALSR